MPTQYSITSGLPGSLAGLSTLSTATTLKLALGIALAAVVFGLASRLFCITTHQIALWSARFISKPWLRPVIGGVIVLMLMLAVGSRDYLGLGVDSVDDRAVTIVSSFRPGGAESLSWLWKLLFTAITVGSGFKGGEVTPLFFIGASMGNVIANLNGLPVDLLAGLGFVSVFAAATKTPIACTLMSVELFGGEYTLWFVISCAIATLISGSEGIYKSQRRRRLDRPD
jgi:H+/Cl- antiporter ClcA